MSLLSAVWACISIALMVLATFGDRDDLLVPGLIALALSVLYEIRGTIRAR